MQFLIAAESLISLSAAAADFSYKDSSKVNLSSPKLLDVGRTEKSSLDRYKIVDLSANVTVGSSCGEMNISKNLRANLNELLGDAGFHAERVARAQGF